jgi:hypothetical protein
MARQNLAVSSLILLSAGFRSVTLGMKELMAASAAVPRVIAEP